MTQPFADVVIGGVLISSFAAYAVAALIVFLALRPILNRLQLARMFSHPSVAGLSLYVTILGLVILLV
jgi:Protein of unknown function (DUF1656)